MKASDKESSSRKSTRKKARLSKDVGHGSAGEHSTALATDDGTVSDDAALFLLAKEAVLRAEPSTSDADARKKKIEQLKKALAEGSYSADARAVAEKVLEEHLDHDFGKNRL